MHIFFLGPHAIPTILKLQYAILGNIRGIGDGRAVWIRGDCIRIAARLFAHPLAHGRSAERETHDKDRKERPHQVGMTALDRLICAR